MQQKNVNFTQMFFALITFLGAEGSSGEFVVRSPYWRIQIRVANSSERRHCSIESRQNEQKNGIFTTSNSEIDGHRDN